MAELDDLTQLLAILRSGQANPFQRFRDYLAQRSDAAMPFDQWKAQRDAAIKAAGLPADVTNAMLNGEDYGEGERIAKPMSPALQDLWDSEERARAGARPGEPSTTGAPPEPGRDIPLEYGLHPENSGPPRAYLPDVQPVAMTAVPGNSTQSDYYRDRQPPIVTQPPTALPAVPGSADKNRFWNPNSNIAPYNAPGVQDDRIMPVAATAGTVDPQRLQQQLAQLAGQQRQNPEDIFTPQQNFTRNQSWAKPGPYFTQLAPEQEAQFRQWVAANKVPFDPAEATPDYDMRGFWGALQAGDQQAKSAIDPNDQRVHYPDYWKTPYDATFSAQSKYATPSAPNWKGDKYSLPDGTVLYDDKVGKWYGALPPKAPAGQ